MPRPGRAWRLRRPGRSQLKVACPGPQSRETGGGRLEARMVPPHERRQAWNWRRPGPRGPGTPRRSSLERLGQAAGVVMAGLSRALTAIGAALADPSQTSSTSE